MTDGTVGDDELLYRSARARHVTKMGDAWRISDNAFNDTTKKISVDRASLRKYDPTISRMSPSDGVLQLVTVNVRGINLQVDGQLCVIDVEADPVHDHPTLPDNPAHALIVARCELTGSAFKRLKAVLGTMATVVAEPE